jgi:hypothetical protein
MDGARFIPSSGQQLIGKTDCAIATGNEGAISVWWGAAGEQFDTGDNVEAFATADFGGNKFVYLTQGEIRDDEGKLIYKGWLASAWEA